MEKKMLGANSLWGLTTVIEDIECSTPKRQCLTWFVNGTFGSVISFDLYKIAVCNFLLSVWLSLHLKLKK